MTGPRFGDGVRYVPTPEEVRTIRADWQGFGARLAVGERHRRDMAARLRVIHATLWRAAMDAHEAEVERRRAHAERVRRESEARAAMERESRDAEIDAALARSLERMQAVQGNQVHGGRPRTHAREVV